MKRKRSKADPKFGASFKTISLARQADWPAGRLPGARKDAGWWKQLAKQVREFPRGRQTSWGIPFHMSAKGKAILAAEGRDEAVVRLSGRADFVCLLHEWRRPGPARRAAGTSLRPVIRRGRISGHAEAIRPASLSGNRATHACEEAPSNRGQFMRMVARSRDVPGREASACDPSVLPFGSPR